MVVRTKETHLPVVKILNSNGQPLSVNLFESHGPAHFFRPPWVGGVPITQNDVYGIDIENIGTKANTVKLIFHIDDARGITGIGSFVKNATDSFPAGVHVQLSKNWHTKPEWTPLSHDGTWLSAVLILRIPPSTQFIANIEFVYQFFGTLHSVSHAQLSLIGSGSNGLWEEVGLGSAGESITFEPDGQQRRNLVLDTRPFLVCEMNQAGCEGTVQTTGWTENHGGSDFLTAVDFNGTYQYLINVTTYHHANGPKLTNATYSGKTVDGALQVKRSVSTWAADDFPRHLHSFRYDFLEGIGSLSSRYPRFALYLLGGDWYNYVKEPRFVYGGAVGAAGGVDGSVVDGMFGGGAFSLADSLLKYEYASEYVKQQVTGCDKTGAGRMFFKTGAARALRVIFCK